MNDHVRAPGDRTTVMIVSVNPTARDPNGRRQVLALVSIIVASTLVILVGVPMTPRLLLSDGTGPPPVHNSVVAVGNLACGTGSPAPEAGCGDQDVVRTVDTLDPGLVLPLGDVALPADDGVARDASARVWRRLAERIRPVLGRQTPAATSIETMDSSAQRLGYYSYDYAGWHLIALNSDCPSVGGCGPGSPQERWLAEDLRRSRAVCTLAYWNKPRFVSVRQGGDPAYDAFWKDLYAGQAEIVLNAGPGGYERFARQSPAAALDVRRGLRQFVVGPASVGAGSFTRPPLPRSVVRNDEVPGVLQLLLEPNGYRWQFVSVLGKRFRDTGTGKCH
jgi:hypothetical protein